MHLSNRESARLIKESLLKFRDVFSQADSLYKKIEILIYYSSLRFKPHNEYRRKKLRQKFNINFKAKKYMKNSDCEVCLAPAENRHHIVQLQHGGKNIKRNQVNLCVDCHKLVHPWMK